MLIIWLVLFDHQGRFSPYEDWVLTIICMKIQINDANSRGRWKDHDVPGWLEWRWALRRSPRNQQPKIQLLSSELLLRIPFYLASGIVLLVCEQEVSVKTVPTMNMCTAEGGGDPRDSIYSPSTWFNDKFLSIIDIPDAVLGKLVQWHIYFVHCDLRGTCSFLCYRYLWQVSKNRNNI